LTHYGYMKRPARNRIAEHRKARGMTQQGLADAVGAHWITISKLERGRIKLTTDWLEKLAPPLGVHAHDLLPGAPLGFAEPENIFSSPTVRLSERKKTPFEKGVLRITIDSSAYEPLLHAGDEVQVIPWADLKEAQQRQLEGKLCFFEIRKRTGRLGFLYSAKKAGTYDLFWLGRRVVGGVKPAGIFLAAAISFRFEDI
jgi:DNA-binding XRE family transcriptional regulator